MLQIRPMNVADVPLGMRLKRQAGWNQVEADWRRLLELEPEGCFVAEYKGTPAGTVASCLFDEVGWVALLLVDESQRRQGIGTALMQHLLAWLEQRGVRSIRLDATPLGQPLYEKLGFSVDYSLSRYCGVLPAAHPVPLVQPVSLSQLEDVIELDRSVYGVGRARLLERLFAEYPRSLRVIERDSQILGYVAVRPGSEALHVGPCVALPVAGPALFTDVCARFAGRRVYIDIPEGNAAARALAESMGLQPQRQLVRMTRGDRVAEQVEKIWASSGPEKG